MKKYAGDQFEIHSAGLEPTEINPYTLKVLHEEGFDTTGQYAKPLSKYLGTTHFSYLITVCSKAEERCPIFPGIGKRIHWPFEDPADIKVNDLEKLEKKLQFRHYRGLRWEVGVRFEIPRAIAVLSRSLGHDAGRFYGIRPI